jgi:hypothetical protein
MEADNITDGIKCTLGLYYVTETLFPKIVGLEKLLTPQSIKIKKLILQLNPK